MAPCRQRPLRGKLAAPSLSSYSVAWDLPAALRQLLDSTVPLRRALTLHAVMPPLLLLLHSALLLLGALTLHAFMLGLCLRAPQRAAVVMLPTLRLHITVQL